MAGFLDDGKYVEVVHSGLTYIGYAWPGTVSSDPKWRLKRIVIVGNLTKIEYALPVRGSNSLTDYFIFKWDDRASGSITWG